MTVYILLTVLIMTVAAGFFENRKHLMNLKKIPMRIHVNGTRGKSSVTRLIAAGLNAGGIRTFAKTTGTVPRVITPEGEEFAVYRPSGANIIEQLRVVSFAAQNGAQALVIECMALQPSYQALCELNLIKSNIGVITNARADHLDVMGPDEISVAKALLGTTPVNGTLYTCEEDYVELFQEAVKDRKTDVKIIGKDDAVSIPDDWMDGFSYIEHKENVALSLAVCKKAGVEPAVAIKGMHKVLPDTGAMSEHIVEWYGRKLIFVNGFAANDPESTETIWNMALDRNESSLKKIMIVNCRSDRPERSDQIGKAVGEWEKADVYIAVGTGTYIFIRAAIHSGISPSRICDMENGNPSSIFEKIIEMSAGSSLIMGICNIKGVGFDLVKYFSNRSQK